MWGDNVCGQDGSWRMVENNTRLDPITIRMPLWAASIDLTVADFFLGAARVISLSAIVSFLVL